MPFQKINTHTMAEFEWNPPEAPKFGGYGKEVSEALGRDPKSTDLMKRHPFDVEIARVPPQRTMCPYHSHSLQWEFYHVVSGRGQVRHAEGLSPIEPGDAFLFKPGEAHTIINDSDADLIFYIVADNPMGESCHYPDSNKWAVRSPEYRLLRSEPLDYFDGEV